MSAPLVAVLPAKIRARWDRLAMDQLAQRIPDLEWENDNLRSRIQGAENSADYWEQKVRRAEDEGARFALTQDGQLYRLESAEA
jgi:hypothetical protein